MLYWLFAGKIGEWHEMVNVQTREKDTGAWFLVMEDFRKWINREIPWLNCQGNRTCLGYYRMQETPTEIYSSDHIKAVCLELVIVEAVNNTCRLVHRTFQEYHDLDDQKDWVRKRSRIIAKANLQFICRYSLITEPSQTEDRLYEYAVR